MIGSVTGTGRIARAGTSDYPSASTLEHVPREVGCCLSSAPEDAPQREVATDAAGVSAGQPPPSTTKENEFELFSYI